MGDVEGGGGRSCGFVVSLPFFFGERERRDRGGRGEDEVVLYEIEGEIERMKEELEQRRWRTRMIMIQRLTKNSLSILPTLAHEAMRQKDGTETKSYHEENGDMERGLPRSGGHDRVLGVGRGKWKADGEGTPLLSG